MNFHDNIFSYLYYSLKFFHLFQLTELIKCQSFIVTDICVRRIRQKQIHLKNIYHLIEHKCIILYF
jgi:hypothetical protein